MKPDDIRRKNLKRGGGTGRPKGCVNKVTRDAQAFALKFMEDPAYLVSLKERLLAGKAPHMETLICQYAYGRPKENVSVEFPGGVLFMSPPVGSPTEWANQFTHAKKEPT